MDASAPTDGPFTLHSEQLGSLPVVAHFWERMGADGLLELHLGSDDGRVGLSPDKVVRVVVSNLAVRHEPVYEIGGWAQRFDPAVLGLDAESVHLLNDDRVGRTLERLFDSDRASLLNRLVLDVVDRFDIDCSELHNDSTSVRLTGEHLAASGAPRGGKPTPRAARGHSKDHRPDLKQLLYILSVSADGAIPIAHKVMSGNTEDSTTHIATWNSLRAMFGRSDFLYVADSKLATRGNMEYIDRHQGRFVSVLPASRKEDGAFRTWLVDHEAPWAEAMRRPSRVIGEPDDVYCTTEAPWPTAEGFRVVWVRSSSKVQRDAEARAERIARAIGVLDALNQSLLSNRTRYRDLVAVENAARKAVDEVGAGRWVGFEVIESIEERTRQESRGRPGANTRYRKIVKTRHQVRFNVHDSVVADDARSDGCWPLVTNDKTLEGAGVLTAYKHQPNLEHRNQQLKGSQLVAPVFLQSPVRIEGLMACHFIAQIVHALVELEIRRAMASRGLKEIPLYPESRACAAPSAKRIFEVFDALARQHLIDSDGEEVQVFSPELTPLQVLLLDLLGVPEERYR